MAFFTFQHFHHFVTHLSNLLDGSDVAFFTFQYFHRFITHLSNLLDGSDIFCILSVLLSVKLANVVIKTGDPSEYIVGLLAPQRT